MRLFGDEEKDQASSSSNKRDPSSLASHWLATSRTNTILKSLKTLCICLFSPKVPKAIVSLLTSLFPRSPPYIPPPGDGEITIFLVQGKSYLLGAWIILYPVLTPQHNLSNHPFSVSFYFVESQMNSLLLPVTQQHNSLLLSASGTSCLPMPWLCSSYYQSEP